MISVLVPIFYLLIFGVPTASVATSFYLAQTIQQKIAVAFFAPAVFTFLYIFTAGMLSKIGQRAVIPGVFPRDLKHPVYGPRRLYASAWTAIYYFTPIYFAALSIPFLKKMMFRLFGYKFDLDFTIYPDTWLRDLTCVKFESGAYLANKSTIGTNICLSDGNLLVDRIKIGPKSVVGHGCLLAPGSKLETSAETGAGSMLGVRAHLKSHSKVGAGATLSHGAVIGEHCEIENHAYIGTKVVLGNSIIVPAGMNIPSGSLLNTQEELDAFFGSQVSNLHSVRKSQMSQVIGYSRNARNPASKLKTGPRLHVGDEKKLGS